ncbi:MAG TPA: selenide, water dikinase SelD [Cyclobacteriaceae bacterium]|nr:selenide, water dikinase SelD [Cyclobacteriaceae bacterium]
MHDIKLTSYSHGAGCGCKISPTVLEKILRSWENASIDPKLLVGNETRDDAAAYAINNEMAILSTTDFFMPIVDDPFDFGAIASVNAISDIYAMGGKPLMAISILGWPVDKLPAETAAKVVEGARYACKNAGISLAGGHSIDTPEPIFGLAVTGIVEIKNIRKNNTATPGCELFLTKPLGIGILTTAHKKGFLKSEHLKLVTDTMLKPNDIGEKFGRMNSVKAMTDVTGFGLLGHLIEMCEGSGISAIIQPDKIPKFEMTENYIGLHSIPGGTIRNYESYGFKVSAMNDFRKAILCDPQTSGGLLVAVDPVNKDEFIKLIDQNGIQTEPFGTLVKIQEPLITII